MENEQIDVVIIFKDSRRNEIGRYQCSNCNEYCIVAFNSVVESNFNYCPKCGYKIICK